MRHSEKVAKIINKKYPLRDRIRWGSRRKVADVEHGFEECRCIQFRPDFFQYARLVIVELRLALGDGI